MESKLPAIEAQSILAPAMPSKPRILLASMTLLVAMGAVALWWPQRQKPPVPVQTRALDTQHPSAPLHPVVSRILHEGPSLAYLKFNYLIKELPTDLLDHDIDALITLIAGPKPSKFDEAEWGSLVNDIEECLTVQTSPSAKGADALIAIFRDESRTQLQRDYALQHVGGFAIYLIHTGRTSDQFVESDQARSLIFSSLLAEIKSAAKQSDKPWSGTALNLLDGLLRAAEYRAVEIPGLSADGLVAMALPIARNSSAPLNARLPALQLAARRGSLESAALARTILAHPTSSLMLVQASAAVLGEIGRREDLPLLEKLLAENRPHTRESLSRAIRLISRE